MIDRNGFKEFENSEYARAAQLFFEITRLHRVWGGLHPTPPLKRSDLAVLGAIHGEEARTGNPVNVSHLAHMMKQSKPAVSQKIGLLEEEGYLRRVEDKRDRRITYLKLTDKGDDVATRALREYLSRVEQALELLGNEKAAQLLGLMHELSDALDTVRAAGKEQDDG